MRVERNLLWYVAFFLMTVAGIYGLTAAEDAGPVLLFLAGGFAAMVAAYLWVQDRHRTDEGAGGHGTDAWFPHASIWPFTIGVASFLLFNGLILGTWFLVPGGIVLTMGVLGWTLQTRDRT